MSHVVPPTSTVGAAALPSTPAALEQTLPRILVLEDREADALLVEERLRRDGLAHTSRRARSGDEYRASLKEFRPDVVLSSDSVPGLDVMTALRLVQEECPAAALLVVTGSAHEEVAVACMRAGAADYVLKENLTRLGPAVCAALEKRVETERLLRRRSEGRVHEQARLLDLVPSAIMVFDMQDRVQSWNKAAEALLGYRAADVMGRRASDLDCWGLGVFESVCQKLLERGEWQGELTKFTRDRKKISVDSRWKVVHDESGQPQSILVIESDVTDKKRFEQQLLHAQRMQSMGTLAGGIAHDLNNILSPILMAAQVMKIELKDDHIRMMLDTVESCALRGADVVKQLLTFARGIQGDRVSVQLRHLAKEIMSIVQETFPRSIRLTSSVPRELWPVTGDATQLHQVLLNLCVNARDAMPNGGTLAITGENVMLDETFASMESEARPGPHVLIRVSDTGVGIPAEIVDNIFEPFFTTKRVGTGTGLGLSTVLGIVRSHGGFVRVTSQVGQGSTFKVFLPATPGAQARGGEARAGELPQGHGELILVVDDEAAIRDATSVMLTQRGFKALVASDGAEGLALFAQQQGSVALVLTDIMMPYMDGVALVRALRRLAPTLKVIAASGLMDDPDQGAKINELKSLGVRRFLTKPCTTEDMLFAMHEELSGQSEPTGPLVTSDS